MLIAVLPGFENIDAAAREAALDHMCRNWDELADALRDQLADTACVQTSAGTLAQARDCIDPTVSLLSQIHGKNRAKVPDPVLYPTRERKWIDFFRDLGLQCRIDERTFLDCVSTLTAGASTELPVSEAVHAGSRALIEYFIAHASEFISREFYEELRKAAVVPVLDPISGGPILVRFDQVLVTRDYDLGFLARPLLDANITPPQVFWGKLNIQSPPAPHVVLENLRLLGDPAVIDSWSFTQPVTAVFSRAFTYFADRWDRLPSEISAKLKIIPLIPIANVVVPVNRVYLRLANNLGPFLFELPREFLLWNRLFRELGIEDSPSVLTLAEASRGIATEFGGEPLNPSELQALLRMLKLAQILSESSTMAEDFWLPDSHGVLVPSANCVNPDRPRLLEKLANSKALRFTSPLLSSELCRCFGVPCLSEIVVEKLMFKPAPVAPSRPVLPQELLSSVRRMLWNQKRDKAAVTLDQQQEAFGVLAAAQAYDISELRTCFFADDVMIGTDEYCNFFFQPPAGPLWLNSQLPAGVTREDIIAAAVSEILGVSALPLAPLLRANSIGDIAPVVSLLALSRTASEEQRGIPGEYLLETDHALLQLRPTRTYYNNETVAVKLGDDLVYGAVVVNQNRSDSSDRDIRAPYVSVGSKTLRVLPSQIYSFKSQWRLAGTPRVPLPKPLSANVPRAHIATCVSTKELPKSNETLTPEEYLIAAEDLLRQAGSPLARESKELLSMNLRLQSEVKAHARELKDKSTALDELRQRVERRDEAESCPICLQGPGDGVSLDTALVPCGHLFCSMCAARIATCATCKRRVESRLRVFR